MQGSLEKKIYDTGSFLSEASTWIPEWLPDSAWIEHAPFAFWLVEAHEPNILIELGTHGGYSFFSFCQAIARLKLSTRAYAVDTWKGDEHAGFYGEEVFQKVSKHNAERYSSFSQLVRSTFDDALPYFEDGSVDLLHIDGRHFYEDVKHDFNSWLPKLSERGIVLLHDINVRERSFGVFRYWAELSQRYPHFQFFHGWGLGVLGVGKRLPRTLKAIFEIEGNSKRANKVRNIYARLGASLQDRSAHRRSASEIRLKEAEASALQTQVSTLEAHVAEATAASEAALSEISDLRSRLSASEVRGTELEAALTLRTSELSELKTEFAEKEEKAARHCGELETALCETRQELDSCKRRFVAAQAALTREHEDAAQHRADLERRLVEAEQSAAQQCLDLQGKLAEAKRSAAQQCADLQDKLAESERSAAQQCADLKSKLAEERQKLQSTVAKLAAARNEHQAALRDIRRDLASKTAQFDAAEAQLDAAEAQFAESTAELARQRDDAARQLVELEAQRVASQERAIAAENRCESLQAEHDGLLNSTFWRATAPARRLGAVLPQGVRRQARRGARLLYWVLTPHRTAARIAHRRARRENPEKGNTPAWAELFDRNWYLARYPDVAAGADKTDPLRHFIHHGAAERRDPNPFFNTSWYLETNPDVARAGDNALAHYFEHGAAQGRDPSPLFDTSWYLETNRDVAEAGTNPLLHYLRHGAAEGRASRAPEPAALLMQTDKAVRFSPADTEVKAPVRAELFDANSLLEACLDAAKSKVDPLNHVGTCDVRTCSTVKPKPTTENVRLSLTDSGLFDPVAYLRLNEDLSAARVDPWAHYLEYGIREGRQFTTPEIVARAIAELHSQIDDAVQAVCQLLAREADQHSLLAYAAPLVSRAIKIGVYCSSQGNFFMQEIANLVQWQLKALNIDAHLRTEQSQFNETFDIRIFVAPHEFFWLGRGEQWRRLAGAAGTVLYNVEQVQTPWFCRAFPFLLEAPLILDINFQSAVLLRKMGLRAIHYMPPHLPDCRYTLPRRDISSIELLRGYEFSHSQFDWTNHRGLADRPIDILFVGTDADRRRKAIERLRGLTDKHRFICVYTHQNAPLATTNYRTTSPEINCAMAQRTKIVLNIHRSWLGYFEWSRMAMQGFWQGACVVSDPGLPDPVFRPDQHFFEENIRHLPELLTWLLDTQDGREKMNKVANAGYNRARSSGARAAMLFPLLKSLRTLVEHSEAAN